MKELRQLTDQYAIYLAIGLSFIILFTPGSDRRLPLPGLDKLVHFMTFGLLALTAYRRFKRWRPIALALFVYAFGSELIQHYWIPGREFDWLDIIADSTGLVATLAFLKIPYFSRKEAKI